MHKIISKINPLASTFACVVAASAAFYSESSQAATLVSDSFSANAVAGSSSSVAGPPGSAPPPSDITITVDYQLHSDSSFIHRRTDFSDPLAGDVDIVAESPLAGVLSMTYQTQYDLLDDSHEITVAWDGLSIFPGNIGTSTHTLLISTEALLSGRVRFGSYGEPVYENFGNASFSNYLEEPFLCVECGYLYEFNFGGVSFNTEGNNAWLQYSANRAPSPRLLRYYESNPYGSGASSFDVYISAAVPLPATLSLFVSALSGLLMVRKSRA